LAELNEAVDGNPESNLDVQNVRRGDFAAEHGTFDGL
jgi:hypothetical protein